MDGGMALPSTQEVDSFVEKLLGARVAAGALRERPSTNAAAGKAVSEEQHEAAAPTAPVAGARGGIEEDELKARVQTLQRENALYRGAMERLRAMMEVSSRLAAAEAEKLTSELAACRSTMASQAEELAVLRLKAAAAEERLVQQRVDGMQSQIDELRYVVRELSVQASQSRAASVRSPPLRPGDSAFAATMPQDELMTLRSIIRQQQQTIAALQEANRSRLADVAGCEDAEEFIWEDPEPSLLGIRGTDNLPSPSRASGRVMFAEDSEESPHPAGLVRGGSSSTNDSAAGAAHRRGGSEEEPDPQIPTLHYKVCADKENVNPGLRVRQQPQQLPLAPRPARVNWQEAVETTVVEQLVLRCSDGSGTLADEGSGVATPPPRATVLLNGTHASTLSFDDDAFRTSADNTADTLFVSPRDAKKRTANPIETDEEKSSDASSDVSYVGRKPRGAISLSMPRRSVGSCVDRDDEESEDVESEEHRGGSDMAADC